ncbi:MarR family winged helix-turn-helix transcriptional regulator [Paeniglutamicibacter psychrophenolicus]|uniref:DNA-binding MarR family transcriptional regulator n=1 Tax=Paeniglutamicibacter psychrophenolicus TaxID=257454 RepID=A0ABS4WBN7_9MICC|nr:MarR family winged helix-turn-helix transcriptional regulator [Paeniglutamicibacter psychrophenolicus]MBP2373607.1 DNA-binding MarR family transcriptional regulator [Paeniglutamicibacter psychrophenolicus]
MSEPRWLNKEEAQLWLEFREFLWGFPSAMDRQLTRDAGMSSGEYAVLAAVSQTAPDALRSGDLAATLQWERSRVSHLLRRMEAKGLIERCASSCDGRGQDIKLTEAGWKTIRGAAPDHVSFVRETLFDPLSVAEQEQFGAMLAKIRSAVVDRDLW